MDSPPRIHRLGAPAFIIGTAVIVVAVGVLAAIVTWAFHPAANAPCTINCAEATFGSASSAALVNEPNGYRSSAFGFTIEYSGHWTVASTGANGAAFDTRDGYFEVVGMSGSPNAGQLIQQRIQALNPQVFPDVKDIGALHGAHIGDQDAAGELFQATYVPQGGGGRSIVVDIGVMVATRNGLTVRALALGPYNTNHSGLHGGLDPAAGDIDYALDEFVWPGE
jgi:hypothetical protein